MIKTLAICLIAMYVTSEPCQKGCLRCQNEKNTTTKICTVCNPNGYIFDSAKDNKECKQIGEALNNCVAYTSNGTCLVCNEHYLLKDGKCTAVTTKITDCIVYESATTCRTCYNKKIIASDKLSCVTPATDKQIANCNVYATELLCAVCVDNFGISWDAKKCDQLPTSSSDNCAVYEKYQCKECSNDFFYNQNLEIYNAAVGTTVTSNMFDVMENGSDKHRGSFVQCQATLDENCVEFESFDKCKTCAGGYYLTSTKTCQIYPLQRIDNCKVYSSAILCKACEDNFQLNSSRTQCVNIPPDPQGQDDHCAKYATDVITKTCTLCEQDYYLNNKSCQVRVEKVITNCDALDPNADQCLTCKTGFVRNTNNKKCLVAKPNCISYNFPNDVPECTKCGLGFYLNNATDGQGVPANTCVQGTRANCKEYDTTQNNCVICDGRFIVPFCTNQKLEISNCKTYYQDEKEQKCTECSANYAKFKILEMCVETYAAKSNCLIYDTNGNCTSCEDGFWVSSGECRSLPTNCKTGTSDTVCTVCKDGYGINFEDKCVTTYNLHSQFCLDQQINYNNGGAIENSVCSVCESGAINYQVNNNERVCVNKDSVKNVYEDANLDFTIVGCISYTHTPAVVCDKCEAGKYLAEDFLSCGTCDGSTNTVVAYEIDGSTTKNFNYCKAFADPDDQIKLKAPALDKSLISIECKSTSVAVVAAAYWSTPNPLNSVPKHSNAVPTTSSTDQDWIKWPLHVSPEISLCHKKASGEKFQSDVASIADNAQTTSCAYWVSDGADRYDCLRCPFGQVPQGATFDTGYFKDCATNNSFSSQRYQNIPPIWAYYFSVHSCTGGVPVLAANVTFADKKLAYAQVNLDNNVDADEWIGTNTSPYRCINLDSITDIRSKLNIPSANTHIEAMTGCGLAVLDIASGKTTFDNTEWDNTATNGNSQSLSCAACKHGYKPTYRTDAKFVSACTEITNCNKDLTNVTNSRKMFNGCYKCNSGYTHGWTGTAIDYTTCVKIPESQSLCLAYTRDPDTPQNTANTGDCKYCPRGYVLNQDQFCSKITFPQCVDRFFQYEDVSVVANLNYKLYTQYRGQGCTSCTNGTNGQQCTDCIPNFFAQKFNPLNLDNDVCVVYQNITQNQGFDYQKTTELNGTNNFIDFCKYYDNNSTLACHECFNQSPTIVDHDQRRVLLVDNINSTSGSKCIKATQLGKCRIAKKTDEDVCLECYDNQNVFLKLVGAEQKCETVTTVENCKNYYLTTAKTDSDCKDCIDGYYLKDKKCHKGYVPQCKVYKTDGTKECTECNTGYVLHPNKKYCFLNNFATNCLDVNFPSDYEVECNTCNNPTQAKFEPVQVDIGGNQTDDKFTVKPVGASNSTDFPLSFCAPSNPIPNCAELEQDGTKSKIFQCKRCNDGYFLNTDEDSYYCQERANKQNECKTYHATLDECTECIDKFYLDNLKKCQPNPIGTRNCLIFEAGNKCVKCKENHYLDSTNDKCIEVVLNPEVVVGCKFYSNATTCNECDPGLYLDVVNNKCESPTLTQPDNCFEYQSKSSCKVCDDGYHPDNTGKCIENGVAQCQIYDQVAKRCTKCSGDNYLSFDTDTQKQVCLAADKIQGCQFYLSKDKCQLCDSQNYLNVLGKCETLKGFMDDNCEVTEETTDFQCFLCKQGYYFNTGKCTAFTDNSFSQGCSWANPIKHSECIVCSVNHYMNTQGTCISTVINNGTTGSGLGLVRLCMFVLSVLFFQL